MDSKRQNINYYFYGHIININYLLKTFSYSPVEIEQYQINYTTAFDLGENKTYQICLVP